MGNSIVRILLCIRPIEGEVEVFNRGYRRGLEAAKGQESEEHIIQLKLIKLAQYIGILLCLTSKGNLMVCIYIYASYINAL